MGHVFKKSVVFINYISSLLLICRILDDIMLDVFQRDFISNHMIIKPGLPLKSGFSVFWIVRVTADLYDPTMVDNEPFFNGPNFLSLIVPNHSTKLWVQIVMKYIPGFE